MKYIPELTKEELQEVVSKSTSYTEVMKNLGYKHTNHQDTLRKYIKLYNIDISSFKFKFSGRDYPLQYKNDEIFCKNNECCINVVKRRILKENLVEYKCALCGNDGHWLDKELILQLDHIDGDKTNNCLTNLRWLCPNCHSQTDTYANKKRKR